MCTLSFIPKPGGYLIGMNRDERLSRETALLPEINQSLKAIYPREEGGGTWIAANGAGVAFALLNRKTGPGNPIKARSRGEVIPSLAASRQVEEAFIEVGRLDSRGMLPFRLAGFFPAEKVVMEWTWDSGKLSRAKLPWQARHWFSSGISDEMARRVRSLTCAEAWRRRDAGSPGWLRGLHASHAPSRGSFSICVHRSDAGSVSYTEIACDASAVSMKYHRGQPCRGLGQMDAEITLTRSQTSFLAAAS
jgi:hypothetical protein